VMCGESTNDRVKIWNVESGRLVHTFHGEPQPKEADERTPEMPSFGTPRKHVGAVAFSPDETLLATGEWNLVRLWDLATGKELRRLTGHAGYVVSGGKPSWALVFSRDGKRLLSASGRSGDQYQDVKVWDLETGKEIFNSKWEQKSPGATLSADGEVVVC